MLLQGERSFHIFYQMIRGAAQADRELWKLPEDVSFFKYLDGPDAVTSIEGVDDAKDFQEVCPPLPTPPADGDAPAADAAQPAHRHMHEPGIVPSRTNGHLLPL